MPLFTVRFLYPSQKSYGGFISSGFLNITIDRRDSWRSRCFRLGVAGVAGTNNQRQEEKITKIFRMYCRKGNTFKIPTTFGAFCLDHYVPFPNIQPISETVAFVLGALLNIGHVSWPTLLAKSLVENVRNRLHQRPQGLACMFSLVEKVSQKKNEFYTSGNEYILQVWNGKLSCNKNFGRAQN